MRTYAGVLDQHLWKITRFPRLDRPLHECRGEIVESPLVLLIFLLLLAPRSSLTFGAGQESTVVLAPVLAPGDKQEHR